MLLYRIWSHKLLISEFILRILEIASGRSSRNVSYSRFLRIAYRSILTSKKFSRNLLWELFLTNEWGGILCCHFLVLLVMTSCWRTCSYLRLYSKDLILLNGHTIFISAHISVGLFGFIKLLIVGEIFSKWSDILECFVNKWVFVKISRCSSTTIMSSSFFYNIST